MPVMAAKAITQLFTDRTVPVHGKHRGQADSGHAEDITGASSRWSQMQVNLREAAFPPPYSCQQGTPTNPRSRRGRKTWRKTNHSLLLPPVKQKREETWKRSCIVFAALAGTSLQPVDSSVSEEFALGPSSLPPDQNYPHLFFIPLPLESQILLRTGLSVLPLPPLTAAHRHGMKHHSSL